MNILVRRNRGEAPTARRRGSHLYYERSEKRAAEHVREVYEAAKQRGERVSQKELERAARECAVGAGSSKKFGEALVEGFREVGRCIDEDTAGCEVKPRGGDDNAEGA